MMDVLQFGFGAQTDCYVPAKPPSDLLSVAFLFCLLRSQLLRHFRCGISAMDF